MPNKPFYTSITRQSGTHPMCCQWHYVFDLSIRVSVINGTNKWTAMLQWPDGEVVWAFDLRLKRSLVWISAVPLSSWASCSHTCAFVTKQYNLVLVKGWWCYVAGEVTVALVSALAMHHRLQWFIHLRAHGLRKGDVHPAYTPPVPSVCTWPGGGILWPACCRLLVFILQSVLPVPNKS